jgi:O-acetylhomoserine/O-acetylserine sulfhydrylase-like pyridoxal-dependent enzyme
MSHEPDATRTPGLETRAVHGAHLGATGPVSTPLVHSATFTFESLDALVAEQGKGSAGAFYARLGHPTVHAAERSLALLEGTEDALLFPSGMGAIGAAFLGTLRAGDHVVCVDPRYGGTQALLQWGHDRLGWTHTFVDARRPETWEAAFRPNTRLLHLESPIQPDARLLRYRVGRGPRARQGRARHDRATRSPRRSASACSNSAWTSRSTRRPSRSPGTATCSRAS